VQLEFGFLLGPPDGRYLTRLRPGGPTEAVLVLATLGSPERRRLARRRARAVKAADPEPGPTSRATVVRPEPFFRGRKHPRGSRRCAATSEPR
jgi:hypothetical protein